LKKHLKTEAAIDLPAATKYLFKQVIKSTLRPLRLCGKRLFNESLCDLCVSAVKLI
jgi:hypothetical protein